MADFCTGKQPTREERDRGQDVIFELLNKHRLYNRDLVAGRRGVVALEGSFGTKGREVERRMVSGERVSSPTGSE
jgi:hypothetical protein